MANTGYKKYLRRKEVFVSESGQPLYDQPTGRTEVNTEFLEDGTTADPNYIAPVLDCTNCPETDTTAPSVPTGLASSNITETSFDLSWTASSDPAGTNCPGSGVAKYEVYLDGSLKTSVTSGTSTTITGLSSGTTYSVKIRAVDNANNASAFTSAISVTTVSAGVPVKAVNMSSSGSGSPLTACNYTAGGIKYYDGTGSVPIIGNYIYTDSPGTIKFNGNNLYYNCINDSITIKIDTTGRVVDSLDCL